MKLMQFVRRLTEEQAADYLMSSNIHHTVGLACVAVNFGTSEEGVDYMMTCDDNGEHLLIEQIFAPLSNLK